MTPCAAVHDGVVCVSDHGALTMSGAPRGATMFGPPTTLAPNASSTHATSGYMIAIDDGGAVFVVDAHGATRIGRVTKGQWAGMVQRNRKTGQWELMGEPIR